MLIRELIEKLSQFPAEAEVFVVDARDDDNTQYEIRYIHDNGEEEKQVIIMWDR